MEQGGWFSTLAEELAQCLLDARACAAACELLLREGRERLGADQQRALMGALLPAAAITQVLIDLLDRPRELVLAAAQICRDSTLRAAETLPGLELPLDTAPAVAALRASSQSAAALLEAAGRDY